MEDEVGVDAFFSLINSINNVAVFPWSFPVDIRYQCDLPVEMVNYYYYKVS